MNETKYWVWLSMIFGSANRRLWQLMSLFETAGEAYDAVTSGESGIRLNDAERRNIAGISLEQAQSLMEHCARRGIDIVCYGSENYPLQLRCMADPPAILYVKGDISCLKGRMTVTSVGARKALQYSISAADRICGELAEHGVVIVSGFALGLDIASHMAAANRNCPTVCVMGCGVDVDYPKLNFMFRDRILETGGVFVSEYPPGTPPHQGNFPKRNRILAALGRAAIVFEASERSGSLITASLAAEQGRMVFCMPPADIFSEAYSGNVRLLREGATPIFGSEDILCCLSPETPIHREIRREAFDLLVSKAERKTIPERSTGSAKRTIVPSDTKKVTPVRVKSEKSDQNGNNIKKVQKDPPALRLEGRQKQIAELLEGGALHADIIAQRLEMDAAELLVELTELEIMGTVRSLPGKFYEINKG